MRNPGRINAEIKMRENNVIVHLASLMVRIPALLRGFMVYDTVRQQSGP